ncbi:dihydroneopterin aldolase [Bacillus solimangrovi]|uniref:7,8-dihydroneopterin aldolase n=1 Tax=Bacillus solimangrovi TaxID=1305675 RepID=A0A1E5LEZ5_9BACI|nr:dihydroneopterin aldolase [Bacillus solimangrovi]OEH92654.1 dihydroneopterin aldolase [Bacillus solimangrovi]
MDKIYMNKLAFWGYHGVFQEENKLGQRFFVDLVLEIDLHEAAVTDDLEKTVDYGKVYEAVRGIVEGDPRDLVETVTEEICLVILNKFDRVNQVTVKVVKPDPPIPGYYDSVAVEMTRQRK